ncbi:hypothetical protein KJ611_01425 [Patescibacteria group bacterium]|nr:hypothetical protein [Patescibacteria group bacterium]
MGWSKVEADLRREVFSFNSNEQFEVHFLGSLKNQMIIEVHVINLGDNTYDFRFTREGAPVGQDDIIHTCSPDKNLIIECTPERTITYWWRLTPSEVQ